MYIPRKIDEEMSKWRLGGGENPLPATGQRGSSFGTAKLRAAMPKWIMLFKKEPT
jgi:hypothetical protein